VRDVLNRRKTFPMRVVLLKKSFYGYGGGAEIFFSCAEEYLRRKVELHVIILEVNAFDGFFRKLDRMSVWTGILFRSEGLMFRLYRQISFSIAPLIFLVALYRILKITPHIVHVHESLGPYFSTLIKAIAFLFGRSIVCILTLNDTYAQSPYTYGLRKLIRRSIGTLYVYLEYFCSRFIDSVYVLDERNQKLTSHYFHPSTSVAVLPVITSRITSKDKSNHSIATPFDKERCVLCNATFSPHRRFEDVLKAVAIVNKESGLGLNVKIIGALGGNDAYLARLEREARGYGLEFRVIANTISDTDLIDHYRACRILCFVGEEQTWGLAPLRAISYGVPCVVSTGCGVHGVIQKLATVVSVGDVSKISEAIISPKPIDFTERSRVFAAYSVENYIDRIINDARQISTGRF